MGRRGRRPLATGHVVQLDGSDLAKQRLKVLLESLQGVLTVREACEALGVRPSRFHVMRQEWLQQAITLLEPRRRGRPPQVQARAESARCAALERTLEETQQAAERSELRRAIDQILAWPITDRKASKKKRRRLPR